MHVHFLGICGTFMAGLALLARARGHRVSGADDNAWPPMSTQLEQAGITITRGYDVTQLQPAPDCVVIGNVMTRGNPCIEHLLEHDAPLVSGPAWLAEHVLRGRHVIAVAGTHGKTTTTAMLAVVLERAGLAPGFLVGGLPQDLGESARLGSGPFVIEADEYDTAFFDKRSKFVHYRPRTLVLNNLEYDHADIFPDLGAIQRQFHHLVRILPGNGKLLHGTGAPALDEVLARGRWTPRESFGVSGEWRPADIAADGSAFRVLHAGHEAGTVRWRHLGHHNVLNGLAAIAAAASVGVSVEVACEALNGFVGVRRRLEMRGEEHGIQVYDDFAHHPTAVRTTIEALRNRAPGERILAVLDPRSNTMRMGVHRETLGPALAGADLTWLWCPPGQDMDTGPMRETLAERLYVCESVADIVAEVCAQARAGDRVLVMSNGAFEAIHGRLLEGLQATAV